MDAELPLLCNPFNLLTVSTRDNRHRIMEAAEERSVVQDEELCSKAGSDLTNPRNRLAAEISWLPGLSPRRAAQLLEALVSNPVTVIYIEGVPPLASANLLASAIIGLAAEHSDADWAYAILALGRTVDEIDVASVLRDLNEDRKVAGFAEIRSAELIEEVLAERRRDYRDCIKRALDTLPPQKLAKVCADALEEATLGGTVHAPLLIDELVDGYAVETQAFFTQELENVRKLIARALQDASGGSNAISPVLDRLEIVLRNWSFVARPIQLSARAQGTTHEISRQLAAEVRTLGVDLFNDHNLLDCSQRIVALLTELFGMVSAIADTIAADSQTLNELARKRNIENRLEPLYKLAREAGEDGEGSPASGAAEARRLLDNSKDLLAGLVKDGLPQDGIAQARDAVAIGVIRCAFAYGHKTLQWTSAITLLKEAQQLAQSADTRTRLAGFMEIAKRSEKLYAGMGPVESAPSLQTINGCGVTLYGSTDPDKETGSYIATYYFVFLFVPIFPLSRYRVTSSGRSYRFLAKGPLRTFDKIHWAVSLALILIFLGQAH